MPRAQTRTPTTRARILAAASDEFGALGFAAATVDRIARRARVNKAMIYYHFSNKRALYTCIIREVFGPIAVRVREAAAGDAPHDARLARVIEALVRSVDASTHFLPMFLREIADGGAHLGPEELTIVASIFATVSGIVAEGARQKAFHPVHPVLAHFTLVGPLVMFRATAPIRSRIRNLRQVDIPDADSTALAEHLKLVAHRMLEIR